MVDRLRAKDLAKNIAASRAARATPKAGARAGASEASALGNVGVNCPAAGHGHDQLSASVRLWEQELATPDDTEVRWAIHRSMWNRSPLKKVRTCRRYPFDKDAEGVLITARRREDGGVDVGAGGLRTCASWHSCLQCGQRIGVHRARELEHLFRIWEALGNSVVLATFTCRHDRSQRLRTLVEAQREAWKAVRSDRPWKADLAALGVAQLDPNTPEQRRTLLAELDQTTDPAARRELQRQLRTTTGVLRAFETTHGDEHGWHPHYHVFFLVEGGITEQAAEDAVAPMWERWCEGLAAHGLDAVGKVNGESAGLDVKVLGAESAEHWARYPFKLALEAVGGVFKAGRAADREGRELGFRHRTPAEVMEHLAVAEGEGTLEDDQGAQDQRILREWSKTATDMRFRQCPWPPGMRAWFTAKAAELKIEGPLLEAEQTDEEIAAAEVEGNEQAGHIPVGDWGGVVAYELDTLRSAGRRLGMTGVLAWFSQRGLTFELTDTGTRMLADEQDRPPPGMIIGG